MKGPNIKEIEHYFRDCQYFPKTRNRVKQLIDYIGFLEGEIERLNEGWKVTLEPLPDDLPLP